MHSLLVFRKIEISQIAQRLLVFELHVIFKIPNVLSSLVGRCEPFKFEIQKTTNSQIS